MNSQHDFHLLLQYINDHFSHWLTKKVHLIALCMFGAIEHHQQKTQEPKTQLGQFFKNLLELTIHNGMKKFKYIFKEERIKDHLCFFVSHLILERTPSEGLSEFK